jgi:acyl-CoA synthetase (NDP forming)
MGGIYSEVLKDVSFRLAPVGTQEALNMLDSLRCGPILRGFRGAVLDSGSAAQLIGLLSELLAEFPRIRELDLNPCRVYGSGIAVLDARAVLETM